MWFWGQKFQMSFSDNLGNKFGKEFRKRLLLSDLCQTAALRVSLLPVTCVLVNMWCWSVYALSECNRLLRRYFWSWGSDVRVSSFTDPSPPKHPQKRVALLLASSIPHAKFRTPTARIQKLNGINFAVLNASDNTEVTFKWWVSFFIYFCLFVENVRWNATGNHGFRIFVFCLFLPFLYPFRAFISFSPYTSRQ